MKFNIDSSAVLGLLDAQYKSPEATSRLENTMELKGVSGLKLVAARIGRLGE